MNVITVFYLFFQDNKIQHPALYEGTVRPTRPCVETTKKEPAELLLGM